MAKRKKHKHIVGRSADMALQKELHRQVGIIYSAAAIALHRQWGWGKDRIIGLADMTREVWHECAKTNLRSMPQMLEEETGVEVQCGDGTSWHELAFLNADITKYDRMTNEQFFVYAGKAGQMGGAECYVLPPAQSVPPLWIRGRQAPSPGRGPDRRSKRGVRKQRRSAEGRLS